MARHNKEMTTETKQMILRLKRKDYAHRKFAEMIGEGGGGVSLRLQNF
jgi:hypothetical protein